jgi:ElaB/YqjD/DUF883 family membrane-anchored ribosome-binding protein
MVRQPNDESTPTSDKGGTFESLGRKLDQRPELQAAEQALQQAKEQLHKAQEQFHRAHEQASEGLHQLRGKNVGDVLEGTLEFVRKHPGPGVLGAALCGLFLGRLFRR